VLFQPTTARDTGNAHYSASFHATHSNFFSSERQEICRNFYYKEKNKEIKNTLQTPTQLKHFQPTADCKKKQRAPCKEEPTVT